MSRNTRVTASAVVLTMLLAIPAMGAPLQYPTNPQDGFLSPPPPGVTAASWVLYDESSDVVLASFGADEERSVASITKIMTVLLALERAELSDLVTISPRAADTGERELDLIAGETITLDALVKGAMIHSANDAATAIAEHIGGSVEIFVDLMNFRASDLGLTHTSFVNPHGLDASGHYSSANDMLQLARTAMEHEDFRDIVRSRMVLFPDAPDGSRRIGTTTNLMLGDYEGASGIKTGFTSQALLTFVATAERDGRRLYAVILGSQGRRAHFTDATTLFNYGFGLLGIYGTVSAGIPYTSVNRRVSPGPLALTATVESLVYLAGQGLLSGEAPSSEDVIEVPDPPSATGVTRRPEDPPATFWQILSFWFDGGDRG